MKKIILFLLILITALSIAPTYADNVFTDVNTSHYCFEAVKNLKELGIIKGYSDGSYKPDNPISRAEVATVMCQMIKEEPVFEKESSFSDVGANHWAHGYISKAAEEKIIVGDNLGLFRPDDSVKFEEAVKMAIMATGLGDNVSPYLSDWSGAYLEIAQSINLTEGLRGKKGDDATRADIAVMVHNALKAAKNKNLMLYSKSLYNSSQNIPTNVSFALDGNIFLKDNTVYNKELAKASLTLSMTAYKYIYTETPIKGNADAVLKNLGFEKLQTVNLKDSFSDNNITQFIMGKKVIESGENNAEVIAVVIRGTDNSLKEWTSNFDIGSGIETEEYAKENHKGYDITAQRVITHINKYIEDNASPQSQKVVWLTGHSRGGSVANICAAKLSDEGIKCYAYTFGASKTTVSNSLADYDFIFNVINKDDLVTYLPMSQWGFKNYGKSAAVAVSESLLDQWSQSTGLKNYNYKKDIEKTVSAVSSCASDRKSCYEYPDGEMLLMEVSDKLQAEEYTASLKSTFAKESLKYCSFETVENSEGTFIQIRMQPAFLMHNVAAVMAGKINPLNFITIPLPDYLVPTHSAIISAYMGGVIHPHTPETYYTIVKNITEKDFK